MNYLLKLMINPIQQFFNFNYNNKKKHKKEIVHSHLLNKNKLENKIIKYYNKNFEGLHLNSLKYDSKLYRDIISLKYSSKGFLQKNYFTNDDLSFFKNLKKKYSYDSIKYASAYNLYNSNYSFKKIVKATEINDSDLVKILNNGIDQGILYKKRFDRYYSNKSGLTNKIKKLISSQESYNSIIDYVKTQGINISKSTIYRMKKEFS